MKNLFFLSFSALFFHFSVLAAEEFKSIQEDLSLRIEKHHVESNETPSETMSNLFSPGQSLLIMKKFYFKALIKKNGSDIEIGSLTFYVYKYSAGTNIGYINLIKVTENYQRLKIGSKLMDFCLNDSATDHICEFWLECFSKTPHAAKFYYSRGFLVSDDGEVALNENGLSSDTFLENCSISEELGGVEMIRYTSPPPSVTPNEEFLLELSEETDSPLILSPRSSSTKGFIEFH